MSVQPAGYSGTPLAKKLGIGEGTKVFVKNPPANYEELLAPLPPNVEFATKLSKKTDVAHVFSDSLAELQRNLEGFRTSIRENAAVWVSWPKKTSKVPTDITEDKIRETALPLGFVDIKVCAVSDIWSGLKLVIRKEHR